MQLFWLEPEQAGAKLECHSDSYVVIKKPSLPFQLDERNEFAYETMGQLELQRDNLEEAVKMFDKVMAFRMFNKVKAVKMFDKVRAIKMFSKVRAVKMFDKLRAIN